MVGVSFLVFMRFFRTMTRVNPFGPKCGCRLANTHPKRDQSTGRCRKVLVMSATRGTFTDYSTFREIVESDAGSFVVVNKE